MTQEPDSWRGTEDPVTAFLARLAEDDSLRHDLDGSFLPADVVALAAHHGYQFTIDELTAQVPPLSDAQWSAAALRYEPREHIDSYCLFLEEAQMSKEAIGAFFKKVAQDKAMQEKLIDFAAQNGFEFSLDELSDTDLDAIAGGYGGKILFTKDKLTG